MFRFGSLFRATKKEKRSELYRRLHLEQLENRRVPTVGVLSFDSAGAATGFNSSETQLTPANVNINTFGKLFTSSFDGQVYAQPLIQSGVTIGPGLNTTPGSSGTHDVVFVATEHDGLYAVDSSPGGNGTILWYRTFLDSTANSTTPGSNIDNTRGASSITTVSDSAVYSYDIYPEVGITGTPVIDPTTNTLYVVVKTQQIESGATHFVQELHAINTADGTDRVMPYTIGDSDCDERQRNFDLYLRGWGWKCSGPLHR